MIDNIHRGCPFHDELFHASPRSSNVLLTNLNNQISKSMSKIFQLFQFTDDSPSNPDAQIGSAASENQRRPGRAIVIPFRSPNDQQQVYAIRTYYADGGGNFNFVDFND
jgi:hypothetical protein